jgi:hypothetical protein
MKPPIFRAAIVDNIKDITDMLDGYVSMLPQDVMDLSNAAKALTAHNHVTLKDDPDKRKATQVQAAGLLEQINAALGIAPPVTVMPQALPEPPAEVNIAELLADEPADLEPVATPAPQPMPQRVVKEYDMGGLFEALDDLEEF